MLFVQMFAFALLSLFPETALQDQKLRDISRVSLIVMGTRGAPSKKQLALLQIRDAKILAEKAKLHNFWIEQKNGVFYLYPRTVIAENGFAMAGSLLDAFLLTGGRPQPVWSLPPPAKVRDSQLFEFRRTRSYREGRGIESSKLDPMDEAGHGTDL